MALFGLNPPLGPQPFNPVIYSNETEIIVLPKNAFSATYDNLTIETISGRKVCQCKRTAAADQKIITLPDEPSEGLFLLRNKHGSASDYCGQSSAGYGFTVHEDFTVLGSKSTVKFQNAADSSKYELQVSGGWKDEDIQIQYHRHMVAEISRTSAREEHANAAEPSVRSDCGKPA